MAATTADDAHVQHAEHAVALANGTRGSVKWLLKQWTRGYSLDPGVRQSVGDHGIDPLDRVRSRA
jgi:hypothetical protein